MPAGESGVLVEKPWRTNTDPSQGSPWGFLGEGEGSLLYYLARDYYRGDGVIVDAGSFLGRSAWFFGTGLASNRTLGRTGPLIHCFDNFIVNDQLTTDAIRNAFGQDLRLGASTRHLFDRATRPVAKWLEVHEGDFHTYQWSPRPIEILFVDITKASSLNQRLVESMFPCLIPGRSLVVQQDYHHPWLPHVHTSMEYLHDYFEIVEDKIDDSAVFRLTRPIPDEALRVAAAVHDLPFAEQLALMDRALERLSEGSRRHVALARANLVGRGLGYAAMSAAMDEIDGRYGPDAEDAHWEQYRAQMQAVREELRSGLTRGWQLVQSGQADEAIRIAESYDPSSDRYCDALILRANCLRHLKQYSAALEVLQSALALRPSDPVIWIEKAWVELELGEPEASMESARRGLDVPSQNPEYQARCLDVLALGLSATGKHDDAVAAGEEAVAKQPGVFWILLHQAQNLLRAGRFEEAAAASREVLTLAPSDEAAMYILERAQHGVIGSGKRF